MGYDEPKKRDSQETGFDEVLRHASGQGGYAWTANVKRTYDEYQNESLESVRHNRQHFDKVVSDAQNHTNSVNAITLQNMQNAVETHNLCAKRGLDHWDVAVDNHWNPIQQGVGDATTVKSSHLDEAVRKAVDAAMSAIIANMATGRPPVDTGGA